MKEKKKFNKVQTSVIIIGLLLLSKGFGFIREVLFAGLLGANALTDAYNVSGTFPEIVTGFIFFGIAGAYVPMLADYKSKNPLLEREYTKKVIKLISVISVIILLFAFFFSEQALRIIAPGWFSEGNETAIKYAVLFIKASFLAQVMNGIFAIFENFHIQKNRFIIFSVLRMLPNLFIISFIIIANYTRGEYLVLGKLIGSSLIAFVAFVLFLRDKESKEKNEGEKLEKEWLKKTLILAIPIFISTAINKINIAVDTAISTSLGEGAPTFLTYGFTVKEIVPSLFGGSILYMLYPLMTKAFFKNEIEKCKFYFDNAILSIVVFLLPVSLVCMSFSTEIIAIIYERGAFNPEMTEGVNGTLIGYSIGMVFFSISMLIIQTFQGFKKTKIPLIVAIICVGLNVTLSILLSRRFGVSGVAIATSIAQIVSAILLLLFFRREQKNVFFHIKEMVVKIIKVVVAALLGTGIAKITYILISNTLTGQNIYLPRIYLFIAAIIIGGGIYLLLLKLLKIEELKFIKLLRQKGEENNG